jgi:pyruvate kinase
MDIRTLETDLTEILADMTASEGLIDHLSAGTHPQFRLSAKNLIRYLILRSNDLRAYHGILTEMGLSALRSAEGYVYGNLFHVVRNLSLIRGEPFPLEPGVETIGYLRSIDLLRDHAQALFASDGDGGRVRVMVTLPAEASDDAAIVRDLARHGMDIARINLSHGSDADWEAMVAHVKEAEARVGRRIPIYMDLAGPKLRTGEIAHRGKGGKVKGSLEVRVGDRIHLRKTSSGIRIRKSDRVVPVDVDAVVDDAHIGDLILFDDGMVKGRVVDRQAFQIEIELLECHKGKIGSEKGINLPGTPLSLPALTDKDRADLPFACRHADLIGYSFVRTDADVRVLYEELDRLGAGGLGVVFKIENQEAFDHLPDILLAGMRRNRIGVMVARGDLAVEIGFERISEVQNEILWLCEAAHIPVIWATQVLDNLAKTGIPTRAEISDAALSAQAECVMLNKGPNITAALGLLQGILTRMEGHATKRKRELRALNVARKSLERLRVLS